MKGCGNARDCWRNVNLGFLRETTRRLRRSSQIRGKWEERGEQEDIPLNRIRTRTDISTQTEGRITPQGGTQRKPTPTVNRGSRVPGGGVPPLGPVRLSEISAIYESMVSCGVYLT